METNPNNLQLNPRDPERFTLDKVAFEELKHSLEVEYAGKLENDPEKPITPYGKFVQAMAKRYGKDEQSVRDAMDRLEQEGRVTFPWRDTKTRNEQILEKYLGMGKITPHRAARILVETGNFLSVSGNPLDENSIEDIIQESLGRGRNPYSRNAPAEVLQYRRELREALMMEGWNDPRIAEECARNELSPDASEIDVERRKKIVLEYFRYHVEKVGDCTINPNN